MKKRFSFGRNWESFAERIDEKRINRAKEHLLDRFQTASFQGKVFVDIGCGSGIFSLAALQLGARQVIAFDYDEYSVSTTRAVIHLWAPEKESQTHIFQADVLSSEIDTYIVNGDLLYSWGVLHHTGNMREAIGKILQLLRPESFLLIALYNDEGPASQRWTNLKKLYVHYPPLRPALLAYSWWKFWGSWQILQWLKGAPAWSHWKKYAETSRAMSAWHDLKDWAGGFPFEVATPNYVHELVAESNCVLSKEWLVTGIANNEFLITKK